MGVRSLFQMMMKWKVPYDIGQMLFVCVVCAAAGTVAGAAGAISFGWQLGLVCALLGIATGIPVGIVLWTVVAFVWQFTQETIAKKNFVPLLSGTGASIYCFVRFIMAGAVADIGLVTFAIVVTFMLGAALGGFAQHLVKVFFRKPSE